MATPCLGFFDNIINLFAVDLRALGDDLLLLEEPVK
jgi:hypothetical protein